MDRKRLVLVAILLVSLVAAVPALADAPMEGEVVEGESVPGIALGYSRAQVEAAYGEPHYCQNHFVPGDASSCTYSVSGGGLVLIRYRGADGGFAHNLPGDVATFAGWGEPVSGWTTTAGINTTLAKADPDAVIEAYPDAEVTYLSGTLIESVVDWLQGIEIKWSYDPYTGRTHVSMSIFEPLASLPTTLETHVETMELSAYKDRGLRKINAWVEIQNEHGLGATGAAVTATWELPNGSTQVVVDDFVGLTGVAFFQLFTKQGREYRGTYTIRVNNVELEGYTFDQDGGVTEASIYIK